MLSRFGGPGAGAGQFDTPSGIGVAADGTVYVADTFNDRIERFDSAGNFLGEWGTTGAGPGQFNSPADVAVAADGNVYVADTGNDRIQTFDPSGGFADEWGSTGNLNGQFQSPAGIAVGENGNVYVADTGNNRVQRFAAGGEFITTWGTAGGGPGQFEEPRDLAADAAGNVFVVDLGNDRVQVFDKGGDFQQALGANLGDGSYGDALGEFRMPLSIAVDPLGYVYVADSFNNRVQRLAGEPELALRGKRRQAVARVKVKVDCVTGPCAVVLSGKVKQSAPRTVAKAPGARIKVKKRRLSLASGEKRTVKLKLRKAKRSRRVLKELLAEGGRAKLTVRGVATNEAGSGKAKRKIKLKR